MNKNSKTILQKLIVSKSETKANEFKELDVAAMQKGGEG